MNLLKMWSIKCQNEAKVLITIFYEVRDVINLNYCPQHKHVTFSDMRQKHVTNSHNLELELDHVGFVFRLEINSEK